MEDNNFDDLGDIFKELFGSKNIKENENKICLHCNGTGRTDKKELPICDVCNGKGTVSKAIIENEKTTLQDVTCNKCLGRGKINNNIIKRYCKYCNGYGVLK